MWLAGQEVRCSSKGSLHRSIHLLVFNRSGNVDAEKVDEKDEAQGSGALLLQDTLTRERRTMTVWSERPREIGLELNSVPSKLFKIDACEENGNEFTWTYQVTASGPFVFDICEVTELQWFNLKEVDRLIQEQEDVFFLFPEGFQAFIPVSCPIFIRRTKTSSS